MDKIFNWLFGACFRTLGRFLAIFIVFGLLLFIGSKLDLELPNWLALRVNASMSTTWDTSITNNIDDYYLYDLTSSGYTNQVVSNDIWTASSGKDFTYFENANPLTIATNGIMHTFGLNQRLKKDYLYSLTYYQCSSKVVSWNTVNADVLVGTNTSSVASRPTNSTIFERSNLTDLGAVDNNCSMITSLFVPNLDGSWLGIRLTARTASITNLFITSYGYNIEELGIYSESIKNMIDTSGFATAQSVTQVQQSVNQVQQEVQELNNSIDETNDTIKDDDTSGAEDSASGFFNDFSTETFGLTSIITAPLNAIKSLINSSCNNLVLPLPFVEKNLTLPCMNSIYSNYFKGFFDLYQIITTGLISYYIIVRIFNLVKDFKNPEHDEIEVMDL